MLKANKENSEKNAAMINKLIEEASKGKSYRSLYGYQEKNLIILTKLTHYALGFNDEEVIAIPMTADGEKISEAMTFKVGQETKVSLSGAISLANSEKKIKLQVPGMLPNMMGMKQLEVSQPEEQSALFTLLK